MWMWQLLLFCEIWQQPTDYGTAIKETRATWTLTITKVDKVVALLNFMNQPQVVISREKLISKKLAEGHGKLLASTKRPVTVKYYTSFGRLVLTASYGIWNGHGVPQHPTE